MKSRLLVCSALALMTAGALVPAGARRARATDEQPTEEQPADEQQSESEGIPPFKSDEAPPIERRIHSIAHELAATAKRYGRDSVAIQAALLIHSLKAGAVGVTEVAVVGKSPHAGQSFLEVDVTTGIILDSDGSTPKTEFAHMWRQIAAPVLDAMESFETDPRGLELVFLYGLQRFADRHERKADPSEPALQRMMRVAIPEDVLADLAAGSIDLDAVLARSTVRDDKRVISAAELGID